MSDIFLSYAKEDREEAASLAQIFGAQGWDVFWDREIPVGGSWAEVLETELPRAKQSQLFGHLLQGYLSGFNARPPMAMIIKR